MKLHNIIFKLIYLILVVSIIVGQRKIPYRNSIDIPNQTGRFEQSILNPNRFQMNQGFTLSTSMGGGLSQTTGIYSNFTSYKLSDRMKFNTGFHLIQNRNNLSYSSVIQTGIGYELDLEYQLSPNSVFSFHVTNVSNSPVLYRNLSPFNVP